MNKKYISFAMLRSLLTLFFAGIMITLIGQNNFHRVYTVDPDHHTKNQTAAQLADGNFIGLDLLEDTLRGAANDLLITLYDKKGGIASRGGNSGAKAFRITTLQRKDLFLPQNTSVLRLGTQFVFSALLQKNDSIQKVFGSLNPDGNLAWIHHYRPSNNSKGLNTPFLISNLGKYLYLGTNHPVFTRSQVSLAKANSSGLLEWSSQYVVTRDSSSGSLLNTVLTDLKITKDSTLLASGYVSEVGSRSTFIMESDTLGNPIWSKMYFDSLDQYDLRGQVDVEKLFDSTYVVAASTDSINGVFNALGIVIKTDTLGNIAWTRTVSFGGISRTVLNNMAVGNDNKIVVSGFMRDSLSGPDFHWMAKIDTDGKLVWVKKYPRVNIDTRFNGNLVPAMDNGYAIFSTVDDGKNYLNIIKTDINGSSTCETEGPNDILSVASFKSADMVWAKFDTSQVSKIDAKTDEYTLNPTIVTLERDPTYCPKDSIKHLFDATVKDAVFYEWSTGVKGDSASMITVYDTEVYSVIVTIDNGRECFTLCDTAQLKRYATPIAQISYSLGDFCTTGLITLTANVFAEAGIKAILWNTGATTGSIKVGQAGIYSVTITDQCDEIITDSYELVRMPQIVTSVNITENFSSICQTETGFLEAIDNSFGLLPKKFVWSNGEVTQVIGIKEGGTYCVTVTDICGNTASSCITVDQSKFRQVKITDVIIDQTNRCVNNTVAAEVFFTGDGNIRWSTGQTTKSIVADLNLGTIYVVVSDKVCPNFKDSVSIILPGINFLPLIQIGISSPVICINNSITLTVLYDKSVLKPTDANIIWSTGANTESITVTANGNYAVTVTDKNCAINRAGTSINFIFPLPGLTIVPDSSALCTEGEIVLSAVLDDSRAPIQNPSYLWNTGQTTSSIVITESGKYSVTVTDPQCVQNNASAEFAFTFPNAGLRFASVFFPNTRDTSTMEYNATFGPYLGNAICPESIKDYEFYVFNRWGQKVFESFDLADEWNGTMKNENDSQNPTEVYIWTIKYSLFGIVFKEHGDVTLIRQ